MKIEIKGGKVFRDGVLVGAVWQSMGVWFSRVFAEASELGSRMFHERANAEADAVTRATALTEIEAAPKPKNTIIPLLVRPETFSD